jgi:hypothetical protein
VIAGLLSLVAVPIGWWLAGWPGSLAGAGLAVLVFLVADGQTVREVRLSPDGVVEFRSRWRQWRVPASRIEAITGDLDHDEGIYSFAVSRPATRGTVRFDDFPELPALIRHLQSHNPSLRLVGEWPAQFDSGQSE